MLTRWVWRASRHQQQQAHAAAAAAVAGAGPPSAAAAPHPLHLLVPPGAASAAAAASPRRSFSSGFWDVGHSQRQEVYTELHSIRAMLGPQQRSYELLHPYFTPHGVQLLPCMSELHQTAAVDPLAAPGAAAGDEDGDEESSGMLADSVKRKRKLKMKKHKYKKRMKKLRHQL